MKVSLSDFILAHKKTAGIEFAEKIVQSIQDIKGKDSGKTIKLSITGGEIHTGEPVVDRLKRYESLQEKIARFDRLAENNARIRMAMFRNGEFDDDPDDKIDDFGFEQGPDVDPFGDPVEPVTNSSVAEPKMSAGEPAQPTMPAGEVSSSPDEVLDVSPDDVSSSGMPSQPKVENVQK